MVVFDIWRRKFFLENDLAKEIMRHNMEIGFKHCITLISYQLSALSTGKWFNNFISHYAKSDSGKGNFEWLIQKIPSRIKPLLFLLSEVNGHQSTEQLEIRGWKSYQCGFKKKNLTSASKFWSLVPVPIASANLLTNW
jgi:hypothetical protein